MFIQSNQAYCTFKLIQSWENIREDRSKVALVLICHCMSQGQENVKMQIMVPPANDVSTTLKLFVRASLAPPLSITVATTNYKDRDVLPL